MLQALLAAPAPLSGSLLYVAITGPRNVGLVKLDLATLKETVTEFPAGIGVDGLETATRAAGPARLLGAARVAVRSR